MAEKDKDREIDLFKALMSNKGKEESQNKKEENTISNEQQKSNTTSPYETI